MSGHLCLGLPHKLPVIANLRNQSMKTRHWKILESIFGASLLEEPLTLAALQELDIFSYDAEIQEVGSAAPFNLIQVA